MEKTEAEERLRLMGTVKAEREAEIRSPVSGTLLRVGKNFYPGGHVAQGELLVLVDPADYEIALDRARAALERARADLALERGRAAMAEAEVKTLKNLTGEAFIPTDLALRKPQLQQMEASLASVQADFDLAELQLARTRVTAPFAAVLTQRQVMAGSRVSTGEALATLVGKDRFWIEGRLPLERVGFVREEGHPQGASRAWIHTGSGLREGYVFRILPDLSENARMARILVVVEDPLGLLEKEPSLFLGDYLSLEVEGRRFEEGFLVPHGALRDGDRIWVVDGEKRLRMVAVTSLFSDEGGVYVKADLDEGSLLVVSDLGLAVEGMAVEKEWADPAFEDSAVSGEKD
jgi:RND family efflux transporter MFP subunit